MLSNRIQSVEESKTLKFKPLIQEQIAQGKKVIDFAMGELDFETPEEIKTSTKHALDKNKTRYAQTSGIAELRSVIAKKLRRDNSLKYSDDDIIVSNGSKQILYQIFQVLCNPGDEVIIPVPYWVSFAEQVKLAGAKPVFVQTKQHQLDIQTIENSITKKTKAIVVNSPNNPTGAVFKESDMKAVAKLAVDNNITIIADEAYEMLVYDKIKYKSIASFSDVIRQHTITVQSFSKPYAMTGFRLGYAAAPKDIIKAMSKLQDHLTSNACTFAEYGAIEAYTMNQKIVRERIAEMEARRNIAYKECSKLFECIKPQGAFFLFPDVSNAVGNKSSEQLSMFLLKEAGVAAVQGEAFGAPKHLRISYTRPVEEIKEGFEKIGKALKKF